MDIHISKHTRSVNMKKVLIQFAHPARSKSSINNAMRRAVEGLDNVTVNDLYAMYPEFLIDIEREQALCEQHDIIVFQHPFYWYSTPAIMKEWQDLVLQHGWAFGSKGNALRDKLYLQAFTAGGDADTFQEHGKNFFTIREFMAPLIATVSLCKMQWLPPFVVTGVHRGLPQDKVQYYAEQYRKVILALRDKHVDLNAASQAESINANIDSVLLEVV